LLEGKTMVSSILLEVQRRVAETVRDAAGSWKEELASEMGGEDGPLAREVADAVRLAHTWPETLRQGVEAQWNRADADQIEDYQAAGEAILKTFEETLQAVAGLHLVLQTSLSGRPAEEPEDIFRILNDISRMKDEFVAEWPWINERLIAEARAEYAGGGFRSIEEILDELQGKRL
jgi:hypothetical protein